MSVLTAASPDSPNHLVAPTSHQIMPRNSGSSSIPAVNGIHHSPHATAQPPRRFSVGIKENGTVAPTMSSAETSPPHIFKLANEQLLAILDYLWDEPQQIIGFDRRAYLSQESFRPPELPSATRAQDLGNWRRTCKRFAELGAALQFSTVSIKFSLTDLDRLDHIAGRPHLATQVKKFTYKVPYFYSDGQDRVQGALPNFTQRLGRLDYQRYQVKIREQNTIVQSRKDQQILFKALKAFKRLQHIQILRWLDEGDEELRSWLRVNRHTGQQVDLDWPTACSHSTRTIGEALVRSELRCLRFSSPMFEPRSAMSLARVGIFGLLVSQLTTIEMHFGDGTEDLDFLMMELAPLLQAAFKSAPNLESVHTGFPASRSISFPFENVFHDVTWPKLQCFGIQGWKVHADEIIAITTRHRRTLKGLRLRDVHLKEDSRWKDVLPHIRNTMTRLEWCSLRRIGYAARFDELMASQGGDMTDDYEFGSLSDSNSDAESDADFDADNDDAITDHTSDNSDIEMADGNGTNHVNGHAADAASGIEPNGYDSDQDSTTASTHEDHTDDEHGMAGIQMGFPPQVAPGHDRHPTGDTPSTVLWCSCNHNSIQLDLEDAGPYSDNGVDVPNRTRKVWEKWVIGRCPVHDPASS